MGRSPSSDSVCIYTMMIYQCTCIALAGACTSCRHHCLALTEPRLRYQAALCRLFPKLLLWFPNENPKTPCEFCWLDMREPVPDSQTGSPPLHRAEGGRHLALSPVPMPWPWHGGRGSDQSSMSAPPRLCFCISTQSPASPAVCGTTGSLSPS